MNETLIYSIFSFGLFLFILSFVYHSYSKKHKEYLMTFVGILGLFIIIITSMLYFFGLFNQPQFTITKLECHNETRNGFEYEIIIYEKLNQSNILKDYYHGGYASSGESFIINYSSSREFTSQFFGYYYEKFGVDYSYKLSNEWQNTELVCEDKKVEDLKIPYYEKCFKSDMETFCYLYDGIIIPKKDLTLDWLKENCEPIGFDVDYFGSKPTRYSCVDYKVEVEE